MSEFDLSLIVPTYNQEAFIRESLASVFAQDCPPTEIIISDDNSTDRTYEIAAEMVRSYSGPHTVRMRRNKSNLGSGNLLTSAAEATRRRVAQFHGDDVSVPDRAMRLHAAFEETGAALVSSNATLIDETNEVMGPLVARKPSGFADMEDIVARWDRSRVGATQAFEVALVRDFTPWSPQNYWAAGDTVLPFRATLRGGAYYLDAPLVRKREHRRNFGKEVASDQGASVSQTEIAFAYILSTRAFLKRDLEAYVAKTGETEETRQARTLLEKALAEHLDAWSRKRSETLNSGLRPSWISRDALLEDPKVQTAHFRPDPRGKPFLFRAFTRLARMFDDR